MGDWDLPPVSECSTLLVLDNRFVTLYKSHADHLDTFRYSNFFLDINKPTTGAGGNICLAVCPTLLQFHVVVWDMFVSGEQTIHKKKCSFQPKPFVD